MEVISEINSIMECMDSTFEEYNTTQILSAPLPDDSEEDDILPADKLVVPFLPSEDEILASCAPLITSVKIVIENNDPLLLHLKIFNHYPIVVDFDRTSSGTMGQIQASGLVQLEDSLVSCNGVSLRNIPLDQVAQLLRPPSHPVSTRILEFQRIPLCALPLPTSVTSPASRNSYFQREYDAILKSPLLDDIRIRNLCMRGATSSSLSSFFIFYAFAVFFYSLFMFLFTALR